MHGEGSRADDRERRGRRRSSPENRSPADRRTMPRVSPIRRRWRRGDAAPAGAAPAPTRARIRLGPLDAPGGRADASTPAVSSGRCHESDMRQM